MTGNRSDIIAQLKKEILPFQGFKSAVTGHESIAMGPINTAFPNNAFPIGAVHEFLSMNTEDSAATSGFVSAITAKLMRTNGVGLWISSSRSIFPPALIQFGIQPHQIIFIHLKKEKDCLWAMEEALKCEGLAAVVGELQELNFTASRKLQLAVEQSGVTGFVLRCNPRNLSNTACVTRWQIHSVKSELEEDMPGVGFPRWKVELMKIRNGRPGSWTIEWTEETFKPVYQNHILQSAQEKKTG